MSDQTSTTAPRALPRQAVVSACPYLLAGDGTWRASNPSRDHRCTAVAPPAQLTADKQRRLCLTEQHLGCATYRAAAHGGRVEGDDGRAIARRQHRPIVRTAPMVLDHGRLSLALPRGADRGVAQMALLALMVLAFGAILIARFPGAGGSVDGGVAGSTAKPSGSIVASPTAAETTPDPAGTPSPNGTSDPGASVQATPEPGATAPPAQGATYTVRSGDTLSGIAAEHGTTWQVLAELNDIEDPSGLRVGTVLALP